MVSGNLSLHPNDVSEGFLEKLKEFLWEPQEKS